MLKGAVSTDHECIAFLFHLSALLLAVPEDLPRGLVFPVSPLLDRPVEGDGLVGAVGRTAAAIPAFIRVQDDRGHLFFRIGNKDINLADFHAVVAAGADIGIKDDRTPRADNVG